MTGFRFIFSILLLLFLISTKGQTFYIQKGKKKIEMINGTALEVKTWNDTTQFSIGKKDSMFSISNRTSDSIELRRPIAWKDTISYKFNIWTGQDIKAKKKYYKIPSKYKYQKFALRDISKIKYSFQHDQSGSGCIACIFVPGLNIYYFWSKSYRTKIFDMKDWKFVWK